ncbi:hypothetical protein JHL17_11305 [Azospirillum sp. YIM B02556]|uniref:Uncharacterized protein n=1 Tax=Azospirillum endophyticum TaxID=2800326 RepID=A0ABS1F3I8_9PROT|nr:hypothetical protein [Azospirillum endophyticum]MBK1838000.1 hypothetical protein [Azospirillum endophyticum]
MSTKKPRLPPSAAQFAHLARGSDLLQHWGGSNASRGTSGEAAAIARRMNALYEACLPAKGSRPIRSDEQSVAEPSGASARQIAHRMMSVYDRATGTTR